MKKVYLILMLGCALGIYAQDTTDFRNIKHDEISGFKLYPNPATADIINVTTKKNDIKKIKIFDVFGALILSERITNKTLDISRLSPGVYVVQVTENENTINRKLVVK